MEKLLQLDATLRDWLAALSSPAWLDGIMVAASVVGRWGAVWIGLAVFVGWRWRARAAAAFRAGLAVVLIQLVVDLGLKPAFARERPFVGNASVEVIDRRSETYAFPSGHAASAFGGAFGLSRAWPGGAVVFWPLAVLIALSRIHVGVHYPLDVAGGALVGLAIASLVVAGTRPANQQS